MDTKTGKEQLESYLEIQNRKVRSNVVLVEAREARFPYLLHIDVKPPAKFIPMMPRRAGRSEDNTVPRVTLADTLIGCIVGYTNVEYDFYASDIDGYVISAIDFEVALKPNDRLVYDASYTNEHWLVGYNSENLSFKPREVGKFFMTETTVKKVYVDGKPRTKTVSLELYVEIKEAILLTEKKEMRPGYYRVTLDNRNVIGDLSYRDNAGVILEKIDARTFQAKKKVSAVLLQADSVVKETKKPVYSTW